MQATLQQDECEFQEIQAAAENMIEEVMHMMKHISVMFSKTNPNIFYDLQKYHPKAWSHFKAFKNDCMAQMVERSIERGKKEGLVREDINSKVLSRMRIEQVEMGLNLDVFPPDKFKIVEIQLSMLDHFLHGICTLKGHKLINKYKQLIEEE